MEFLGVLPTEDPEIEVKGKDKKKKSKKALAKAAEEARQQLIKQKQEYLRELKIRVNMEWEINQSKAEVYDKEFQERKNAYEKSNQKLKDIQDTWGEYIQEQRKAKAWAEYLKSDRLPNCCSIPELNSYIFAWTELDTSCLMDDCIRKTIAVMQLFKEIEGIFKDPGPDCPPHILKDLKQLRGELRELLQEDIDKATFYLFSRIEHDMVAINVTTSKYFVKCPHFLMNLWAELMTPAPSSRGKEVKRPRKVTFEEAEVTIVIPPSLNDIFMVIRVMWLNYDHCSDVCRTYDCPPLPAFYSLSLYDLFLMQNDTKKEIMSYRMNLENEMRKNIDSLPEAPTLSQELMTWESEPQRSLSEEVIFRETQEEDKMGRQVIEILNEFEVNLRERIFLGRILLLNIFHQPPQSKDFRFKHSVTLRQEPPNLKPVDFYVKYPPPEPPEEHLEAEEQVENKMPLHHHQVNILAEEAKKLISVQIKIPDTEIRFENPQLAIWDPIHNYWSTEDVHDAILEEEEGVIEFKIGRTGYVGLHVSRYCNFPFEDWLLEPSEEAGINFYLKTPKIELTFNIREGEVCLHHMKNSPSKVMNWIFGKYYKPVELKEYMKNGGINIFPEPDACTYVGGVQSKHIVIERNIYQIWGLYSKSFRFKMSKFNQEAGKKNIVFQAQEIYKNHQLDFCLIQTTMCSSYVLNINEESPNYLSKGVPSMENCIDLFSLLEKYSTAVAKRQKETTCYLLIQTIQEFLGYIRPLSFSLYKV